MKEETCLFILSLTCLEKKQDYERGNLFVYTQFDLFRKKQDYESGNLFVYTQYNY